MKLLLIGLFGIVAAKAQIPYPDIVLADKPAAYWRMGEPAGSPFSTDDSGRGERAVVQGTVFFDQIGALHDSPNTSVELAGAGYFLTPLHQIAVSEYSLEAWVNTFATIAPILQDRGYKDVNNAASVSITMSWASPSSRTERCTALPTGTEYPLAAGLNSSSTMGAGITSFVCSPASRDKLSPRHSSKSMSMGYRSPLPSKLTASNQSPHSPETMEPPLAFTRSGNKGSECRIMLAC